CAREYYGSLYFDYW
nr:immunoglobulin heavy chain junction region [Mus musculus]NSM06841.1 immunoglobulin heavy chain junction region [Mus musculus]NSM07755.1 immunoglobulin heavy chain junction region [Mus musculus]NSM09349.1 immunoglobulin heavy chain junction region [Mus musculus]